MLKAIHDRFGDDERFVMIGLNQDRTIAEPKAFAAAHGLDWIQGFLGQWKHDQVADSFGVKTQPEIMLIGPEGRIRAMNLRGEGIEQTIEMHLTDR